MAENNVAAQESFYRRGLVLGFTMAEVVILIVFALLLTLAAIVVYKDGIIAEWIHKAGETQKAVEELQNKDVDDQARIAALEEELRTVFRSPDQKNRFDDLFRELRLAKQEAAKIDQLRERATANLVTLSFIWNRM